MTLKKLIKKYTKLIKQNYETICITQVVNDLRQVGSIGKEKTITPETVKQHIKESKKSPEFRKAYDKEKTK